MKKKKKSDYSNNWFEKIKKMRTYEDVCKEQLEKLPNVDLRNEYHKGQVVYYVFKNDLTKSVDLYEMKLTTIYPQQAIGIVDDGYSMVISYKETDYVFEIPIKAERLLKKLRKELNVNES